ncbi:MAG: lytic murein transglycosylase [Candidatus Yanofskybacteria bacterium]|nr:lytic murein transglycosylase [Candidatus Yanofskybacteria bacterium]
MKFSLQRAFVAVFLVAFLLPQFGMALTPQQERDALEEELKRIEEEIAQFEGSIAETQARQRTLQNQIATIQSQIRKLDLEIQRSNILIQDLSGQIQDTSASIENTERGIEQTKEQLGELLQKIYQESQKPLLEVVLSGPTISDFFDNVAALQIVNGRNRELLEQFQDLTRYLVSQKESLEGEKTEQQNYARIQLLQQQQSRNAQVEQQRILNITRGQESEYQKLLADRQKQAQEIRSRIFELFGVPDAPTFGEALEIAKHVSVQTGVRPALLLAVLTQESNLGKNVGQCYLTNAQTAVGVNIRTGAVVRNVMKPMGLAGRKGDVDDFLIITRELGRDPFQTPVSCPIPSVGGYGGAMGPAQFIPTTWMAYRNRLAAMLGRPADPWRITDAFWAAALYLGDYGAKQQTYSGEWRAAMIYFSGSTNPAYRFYGDSVMAIAERYQKDIDALEGY